MRIAFFGLYTSFDYSQIGGTDSLVRRLAFATLRAGTTVDFVHYGAPTTENRNSAEGIGLCYFRSFAESLVHLAGGYDHVVTVHVRPRDRQAFARFRRQECRRSWFHKIHWVWPESVLKRWLLFAESRFWPYNGFLFCVSPRLQRYVSRWARRSMLLLPPVPREYFLQPAEKATSPRLRVAFVGRVDPGKGAPAAIEILRSLSHCSGVETRIYGYSWSHRPQTLRLHEELMAQSEIHYEPTEYHGWSPEVEIGLAHVLHDTDVLLLPYRKMSSTVDTPLLLLEGMASLCAIVAPPLGDLPLLYGSDHLTLHTHMAAPETARRVVNFAPRLAEERQRIYAHNRLLAFDVNGVAARFRKALNLNESLDG